MPLVYSGVFMKFVFVKVKIQWNNKGYSFFMKHGVEHHAEKI